MSSNLDPPSANSPPRNLHDSLFKAIFGNPVHAAAELKAVLPVLSDHVHWTSLTPAPTSFINAALRERLGDLVFHARLTAGGEALLWYLIEHQSTEDWWMSLRVLETKGPMWRQWSMHHPGSRCLPPIVPVVVYHGDRAWRAPTELGELCALPDPIQAALGEPFTRCRYVLDDLSIIEDDALRARHMDAIARLTLFALVRGAAEDFFQRLAATWAAELSAVLTGTSRELGMRFLMYTLHRNPHLDPDTALEIIMPAVEPEAKETIVTIADQLVQRGIEKGIEKGIAKGIEKGIAKGIEKGIAKGIEKGRAEILLQQLEKRFGPLPTHVSERVEQASGTELRLWADRVLDAADLDAVLAPPDNGA